MAQVEVKELLDNGVHFGHLTRKWDPNMAPFIYMERNGIHIINLYKTAAKLEEASKALAKIASSGRKILFVATKKQAKGIVAEKAAEVKMPYITERWPGGMLTNFDTVKKSIQKLESLNSQLNTAMIDGLTKKETLVIKKQISKLEKNLSGIKNLETTPDALFVIDTRYEKIAIQEANKLNIPVIAVVDSNNSFDGVDYMIPGNDDSMSSIELFVKEITEIIINTKSKFVKAAPSTPIKETKNKSNSSVTKTKSIKKKQIVDTDDTSTKPDEVGVSSKATDDKKED